MSATATRLTAEQYYAATVEGDRKQLVDGEIVVNEPKAIHAVLQERVAFTLGAWVRAGEGRGLSMMPTDIRMDEHNVYGPQQEDITPAFADQNYGRSMAPEDATFVAHARTDVPDLLAEVERLQNVLQVIADTPDVSADESAWLARRALTQTPSLPPDASSPHAPQSRP